MEVTESVIYDILQTIDDPEMPISIVDLGIVADVRLTYGNVLPDSATGPAGEHGKDTGCKPAPHPEPRHSCRADTSDKPAPRPEFRLSIRQDAGRKPAPHLTVDIDILPTFIGCPALPMIEGIVRERVGAIAGVGAVHVHFVFDPPWSVDRISERGRMSLKAMGVSVPQRGAATQLVQVSTPLRCPFCDSTCTLLTSRFGPTRCRMIYHCEACGNSFEHMKRV